MVLSVGAGGGQQRVAISARHGDQRELGTFEPVAQGRTWAHALPVPVHELESIDLTGAAGSVLRARLPSQGG